MVRLWGLPQGMAASEKRPLPVTSGMQHDSVRLGDTPPEDLKQSDLHTPRGAAAGRRAALDSAFGDGDRKACMALC